MSSINGAEVKKICLACEAGAGSSLMVKNGLVKKAKKAGLDVERNLTLTKELSNEDLHDKMKEIFPTKEAFLAGQRDIMKDLFPDDDEE